MLVVYAMLRVLRESEYLRRASDPNKFLAEAERLGDLPRLGVRDLREQTPRFRLPFERQPVEHVQEAMIPAPLLLRLREHRGQRTPDPEVTIADHHLRRRQHAPGEVPQDRRPALR